MEEVLQRCVRRCAVHGVYSSEGPLSSPCLTFSIWKDKVNWPWLLEEERLNNLGFKNKARTKQLVPTTSEFA